MAKKKGKKSAVAQRTKNTAGAKRTAGRKSRSKVKGGSGKG
jgi:hypothetical protein